MDSTQTHEMLEAACRRGVLDKLLEEYLTFCRDHTQKENSNEASNPGRSKKEHTSKFPNIAGFCRYCGIGRETYEELAEKYPRQFGRLCDVFEDEALNSEISPSLITAYLKERIGYGREDDDEKTDGDINVFFEHDVLRDGE